MFIRICYTGTCHYITYFSETAAAVLKESESEKLVKNDLCPLSPRKEGAFKMKTSTTKSPADCSILSNPHESTQHKPPANTFTTSNTCLLSYTSIEV